MKNFLLIGMGSFGHHMCINLQKQKKCDIMIVDKDSSALEDLLPYVVSAKVADCCDENVLKTFDIPSFDACFVCIGNDFQSSIQITSLLKELGAKFVYAKAEEDVQAKFLLKLGADKVIYPERDVAERIAINESDNGIYDFIELSDDYAVYEIKPLKKWIGKSILELDFRKTYNVSILGIKVDCDKFVLPSPQYIFNENDNLMVIATNKDIERIAH